MSRAGPPNWRGVAAKAPRICSLAPSKHCCAPARPCEKGRCGGSDRLLDQRPIGPGIGAHDGAQIGSVEIGLVRVLDLRAAAQVRLQSHLLLPLPNPAPVRTACRAIPGHHELPGLASPCGFGAKPRAACARCHPLPTCRARCHPRHPAREVWNMSANAPSTAAIAWLYQSLARAFLCCLWMNGVKCASCAGEPLKLARSRGGAIHGCDVRALLPESPDRMARAAACHRSAAGQL